MVAQPGEVDDICLTARFGLLAAAIAGYPVTVAHTTGLAWTNRRTIYVSSGSDTARQVVAQAALIQAGSLSPDVVRALVGRAALSRRYLSLEGRRALMALGDLRPAWTNDGLDPEGAAADLDSPSAALRAARSRARVTAPPDWFGVVKPSKLIGPNNASPAAAGAQSDINVQPADEQEQQADDQPARSSGSLRGGLFGDNPIARALRRQLGTSRLSTTNSAGGAPGSWTQAFGRFSRGGVTVAMPGAADPGLPADAPRVNLYPEWDVRRQRYRPDWCRAVEDVAAPQERSTPRRSARHDDLRRRLAPLGLGLQKQRRQYGGHDVDIDAVIDARVAVAVGRTPTEAVYLDNLRRRRELEVLVLLDASGSANETNPAGSVLYRRQQDAAAALLDTLSMLGDRVSGYAFCSRGREVNFTRIKSFDEPFGALQLARLDDVKPDGFTRLGAAIRHATALIVGDRGMVHQLLIIISDGFPYDAGYESFYAEADARQAVSEARTRGIGCICVNLASTTDGETLNRIFGPAAHTTAEDIDLLAPTMPSLIIGALNATRRRRRAHNGASFINPHTEVVA